MITFQKIYETEMKEKKSKQIQKIKDDFLQEFNLYLTNKKELLSKNKDIQTKKQIESSEILLKSLFSFRRKKIIELALISSQTEVLKSDYKNMFEFEKKLFENLVHCIKKSEEAFEVIKNN